MHANDVAAEARSLSTQGGRQHGRHQHAAVAHLEATARATSVRRAAELRTRRGARESGTVSWVEAGRRCRGRLVARSSAGDKVLPGNPQPRSLERELAPPSLPVDGGEGAEGGVRRRRSRLAPMAHGSRLRHIAEEEVNAW